MSPRLPARLLAAQSDRRLLELVRAGNERAFDVIVQRYRRQLLRYCGRMGLSDSRSEDVLQHSLLSAWLALERGTEVRELRPWLYRIVHNTAVNTIRRAGEEHAPLQDSAHSELALTAENELERRIAVRAALSDVAALPPMQRDAILMSAVDGRSHQEVASALGVTNGAVRGLLYRARATLRGAAAALTPQPLLAWASGSASRVSQTAGRIAEVAGAAGGSDTGSVLMKGAAVAVTTALAAGVVLVPSHHPRPTHSHNPASSSVRRASQQSDLVAPGTSAVPSSRVAPAKGDGRQPIQLALAVPRVTHRAAAHVAPKPSPPAHGRPAAGAQPVSLLTPASNIQAGRGNGPGHGAGHGTDSGSSSSSGQSVGGSDGGGSPTSGSSGSGGLGSGSGESSHTGDTGGEQAGAGSGEHEAEAASEKTEWEAEAARERSEREAEEARERAEREAEAAHQQGSGKDS